jgi:Mn2+/Fe2+ NRAMP family transporter
MAFPGPTSSSALQKRLAFRLFRIAPAIAVIMAVAAVILVIQGKADGRVLTLIAAALGIGLFVLIGYAAMTASQLKKDKDVPRS